MLFIFCYSLTNKILVTVNWAVNFTVSRLEIANKNAEIFDSFKKSSKPIDRVNSFHKQPLISFQTQKRLLIDTENEVNVCN